MTKFLTFYLKLKRIKIETILVSVAKSSVLPSDCVSWNAFLQGTNLAYPIYWKAFVQLVDALKNDG